MSVSVAISFICTVFNMILSKKYIIISTIINFVNVMLFMFYTISDNLVQYQLNKSLLLKIPVYLIWMTVVLNSIVLMFISILFLVHESTQFGNFAMLNVCFCFSFILYWNCINVVKFVQTKNSQHSILPISVIYKFNN
jgi:O-antigen/teichoic acid export membrane protein